MANTTNTKTNTTTTTKNNTVWRPAGRRGYTVQLFIAGYSDPAGTDVYHVSSKKEAAALLRREHEDAERFGAGYDASEACLYIGHIDDVTDLYPEYTISTGPRGGIKWELA